MTVEIPGGVLRTNLRRVSAIAWEQSQYPLPLYGDFEVRVKHPLVNDGLTNFYAIDYALLLIDNDEDITQQSGMTFTITLGDRYKWASPLTAQDKEDIFNRFLTDNGGYFGYTRYSDRTRVTRLSDSTVELDMKPQTKTAVGSLGNDNLGVSHYGPIRVQPFREFYNHECIIDTETNDFVTYLACSNAPMWGGYYCFTQADNYFDSKDANIPPSPAYTTAEWYAGGGYNGFALQKWRCETSDGLPLNGETIAFFTQNGIKAAEHTDVDGSPESMVAGLVADFNTKRNQGLICNQHAVAYVDPADSTVYVVEGSGNNPSFNIDASAYRAEGTKLNYDASPSSGIGARMQTHDTDNVASFLIGSNVPAVTFSNAYTADPCARYYYPSDCQGALNFLVNGAYRFGVSDISLGNYAQIYLYDANANWNTNGIEVYQKTVRSSTMWGVTS